MTSGTIPLTISTFTVLPILLPSVPTLIPPSQSPATHYLYIRPDAPKIPNRSTPRSLFLANIPITTTDAHIRHLFSNQLDLGAGRVVNVLFPDQQQWRGGHDDDVGANGEGVWEGELTRASDPAKKKRKRAGAEDLEARLVELSRSRSMWPDRFHGSGAHAVVVFADKAAAVLAMKAVKKTARAGKKMIVWGEGMGAAGTEERGEDEKRALLRLPLVGSRRYEAHQALTYPGRNVLLRGVNEYMATFSALEEARKIEGRRRETRADEDGFVTVVRGPKAMKAGQDRESGSAGVGTKSQDEDEDAKMKKKRKKGKGTGLEDFYRFQNREVRKEREMRLMREFEKDRKRIEAMRVIKGRVRPE